MKRRKAVVGFCQGLPWMALVAIGVVRVALPFIQAGKGVWPVLADPTDADVLLVVSQAGVR